MNHGIRRLIEFCSGNLLAGLSTDIPWGAPE
jgi:hypothetical protein